MPSTCARPHTSTTLFARLLERVGVEVAQVGGEAQVLEDAHLEVERRALRQVAEALADLERLVEDVVPVDARRARRWAR